MEFPGVRLKPLGHLSKVVEGNDLGLVSQAAVPHFHAAPPGGRAVPHFHTLPHGGQAVPPFRTTLPGGQAVVRRVVSMGMASK